MPLSKEDLRRLRLEAEKVANEGLIERPELEEETLHHELTVQKIELELQNEQLLETERKLNETLERYTRLYHQAPVGYVTLDKKGIIREHNETFAQLLHLPAIKIKNSNFATFLSTDTDAIFRQRLAPFFKQPEGKLISVSLAPEGRPLVHIQVIGRRQTQEHEELIFCSIIDVTFQKQEEKERQELEDQLRQKYKMEAIGTMAGGIAHNFNNNLSVILGNVELSQLKNNNPEVSQLLKNAKIGVMRSRDLVSQIMSYSRKGAQSLAPLQLPLIIDETLKLLSATIPTTVQLTQTISPDSYQATINADASQIQEILLNLYGNAVHAMEEKGTLAITLDVVDLTNKDLPHPGQQQPGRYARITIRDNGCGMTAEVQEKIFDPFFTTKEMHEGTGMGLATVQGIIQQHKGLIQVESSVGQGTTFELYFPLIDQPQAAQPTPVKADIPRGSEKILFVDDDETLAKLGELMLTELGYQVSIMTESPEALKLFAANADYFDLVITDQTMPDLTGKELIQELLKIRPDLPTIICTGYSSQVSKEEAEKLGAKAFVMKPLDLQELGQTVRRVLDGGKEE